MVTLLAVKGPARQLLLLVCKLCMCLLMLDSVSTTRTGAVMFTACSAAMTVKLLSLGNTWLRATRLQLLSIVCVRFLWLPLI